MPRSRAPSLISGWSIDTTSELSVTTATARGVDGRVFGLSSEPPVRVAREQIQQEVAVDDDGHSKNPDYNVCRSGSSATTSAIARSNSPLSRHSRRTA